jgi:hypothetical protein
MVPLNLHQCRVIHITKGLVVVVQVALAMIDFMGLASGYHI